ncbi:MAG: autotransporter-associated beta strand repeat-containing protein [Verrucomicrobia bacterium]|nr:autotransporter-associated beta strand repeat-containing protein [Verrucomicrobiota bacterium]
MECQCLSYHVFASVLVDSSHSRTFLRNLVVLISLFLLVIAPSASATTFTWDGNGPNANWSATASGGNQNNWTVKRSFPGNNSTNDYIFAGTLNLNNTNDYTNLIATSITFTNGAGAFILNGNSITLAGGITNLSANLQTINLGLILSGNDIVNASTANILISSKVSGTGTLTAAGASTLTLSASNSYSGGTILNAGTLAISNNYALGTGALTFASNSTTLQALANLTITNNYTVANGVIGSFNIALGLTLTNSGLISGGGTILLTNGGTLLLSGSNSFLSDANIAQGTLTIGNSYALGSTNNGVFNNGTLNLNGYSIILDDVYGSGTITNSSTTHSIFTIGVNNGSGTYTGTIAGGNVISLVKNGTGTEILTASNAYTGGTHITAGTITVGNANALGNITNNLTNNGTLNLAGFSITQGSLSGAAGIVTNGIAGNATLTVGDNNASTAFAGSLVAGTGTISLVKNGTGTLTLSGINSYEGGTLLKGGTLNISSVNSLGKGSLSMSGIGKTTLGYTGGSATFANTINVTSGIGLIDNLSGNAMTLSGSLNNSGGTLVLANGSFNVSGNISGSSLLSDVFLSHANVTVSGANTYAGSTAIFNGSTLSLGVANAIPSNTMVTLGASSDLGSQINNLNLNGYNQSLTGLTSTGNAYNQVVNTSTTNAILRLSGTSTFSGSLNGGNLGLMVAGGSGTVTLTGRSSYTGITTITSGTLNLSSTAFLTNSSSVVVQNGGTLLLSGSNQVNPNATLTLGGGALSMGGNGTLGNRAAAQTFASLTLTANSSIDFANLSGISKLTYGSITMGPTNKLTIFNWNGTSLWGTTSTTGGIGQYTQLIDFLGSSDSGVNLANISFYSGNTTGSGFLGHGAFSGTQIVPVPEPGVIASAALLSGWMLCWLFFANRGVLINLINRRPSAS